MSKRKIDSSLEYVEDEDEHKIIIRKVNTIKMIKLKIDNQILPVEYKTVKYILEKINLASPSYIN